MKKSQEKSKGNIRIFENLKATGKKNRETTVTRINKCRLKRKKIEEKDAEKKKQQKQEINATIVKTVKIKFNLTFYDCYLLFIFFFQNFV